MCREGNVVDGKAEYAISHLDNMHAVEESRREHTRVKTAMVAGQRGQHCWASIESPRCRQRLGSRERQGGSCVKAQGERSREVDKATNNEGSDEGGIIIKPRSRNEGSRSNTDQQHQI
jgi:hypothetical protein